MLSVKTKWLDTRNLNVGSEVKKPSLVKPKKNFGERAKCLLPVEKMTLQRHEVDPVCTLMDEGSSWYYTFD